MDFRTAVHRYRKEKGLTQLDLAEKWGVGQQTISYWESGKSFPDDDKCVMIARSLRIPLADVLKMKHDGATAPDRDYSKDGRLSAAARLTELEARMKKMERDQAGVVADLTSIMERLDQIAATVTGEDRRHTARGPRRRR